MPHLPEARAGDRVAIRSRYAHDDVSLQAWPPLAAVLRRSLAFGSKLTRQRSRLELEECAPVSGGMDHVEATQADPG